VRASFLPSAGMHAATRHPHWANFAHRPADMAVNAQCTSAHRPHVLTPRSQLTEQLTWPAVAMTTGSNVSVERLWWGASSAERLRSRLGRFDLVIAADVVYGATAVAPLLETLRGTLSASGGFLMAHTPRIDPGHVRIRPQTRRRWR
jgi:hypothetical protein